MQSKLSKYIIALVLVVYTAIIFAPPLMYDYVYPNNGDDTGNHLVWMKQLADNENPKFDYVGQYLFGKAFVTIAQISHIDLNTLFMWANFALLWLIGMVIYFIAGNVVGWLTGLIVIPVTMFANPSVLNLYDNGSIYDLMTVGILIPLMVWAFVKVFSTKGIRRIAWGIGLGIAATLVILVHTSTVAIVGIIKEAPEIKVPSIPFFITALLGYALIAVLLLLIWNYYTERPPMTLGKPIKMLVGAFTAIAIGLAVFSFTRITVVPLRIAVDLAIVVSMAIGIMVAVTLQFGHNAVKYLMVGIVVFGSIASLVTYFSYNSAIRPVDKQAINYLKQLDGEYFSCSSEVSYWIYGNYIDKEYKKGELPFISRNTPMSSKATPGTEDYWQRGEERIPTIGTLAQSFQVDDIVVEIYR